MMEITMEHVTDLAPIVVLGYVAWQVSGFGGLHKSMGKIEQKTETLERDMADTKEVVKQSRDALEVAKEESETAHSEIKSNIKKSGKKSNKRMRKLEKRISARMDAKFDEFTRNSQNSSSNATSDPSK